MSADDPSFLLFHGDKDAIVSIEQSVTMEAALQKVGVQVKFVRVPGGAHGRNFGFPADDPRVASYLSEVVRWLDVHVKPSN